MKLTFLVIVTVIVVSAKLFAEYKQHSAIYDSDVDGYRNISNFFDGVFLGMIIVAAIVEFVP